MKPIEELFTTNKLDSDLVLQKVIELGIDFLNEEWNTVQKNEVIIVKILGGQSNHVFHVKTTTSATPFLLRIHKEGQSQFFTDIVNFAIFSERGLGPKLYGFFDGGRMEQFLPSKTLTAEDVLKPEYSRKIGAAFPRYHAIKLPVPKYRTSFQLMKDCLKEYQQLGGSVFDILNTTVSYEDHPNHVSVEELYRDVEMMESMSTELFGNSLVFCHNDLTCTNILELNATQEIVFIDWEFGSYNYRGYDLAMHMSETAVVRFLSPSGIEISEYLTDHPTNLREFCAAYVESSYQLRNRTPINLPLEVAHLMKECLFFWPITHLFWACLIMKLALLESNRGTNLNIQARDRLAVYFHLKANALEIYKEMREIDRGKMGVEVDLRCNRARLAS